MLTGSFRSIGGFSVSPVVWFAPTHVASAPASDAATSARRLQGIEDHHPGHRVAAFLLLGGVDAMRADIDGQAVNLPLHREVLELAEVLRVVLLEDRDRAAPTCHV